MKRSDLGPMGFTYTHSAGYEWAGKQVLSIRKAIAGKPLPVQVEVDDALEMAEHTEI